MRIMFNNFKVPVKNLGTSSVVLLCLSLLLSACGGGGPGDEGEKSAASTQNTTSTNPSFSKSSDTATLLSEETDNDSQSLCQQQNSLLCEEFEWSSSLAYKASPLDWSLKGWQFTGVGSSGNFCNNIGVSSSQCALMWSQKGDETLDTVQKASYSYSEYGAGFNKLSLSWSAKWSEQWAWNTETQSHLVLESINVNKDSRSLLSVVIDSGGFIQLIISGDKQCAREEITIESDMSFALQATNLGKWQQFKLEFNLDAEGTDSEVYLSINNAVIISKTNIKLGCVVEYSAPDTVSFTASSYNSLITGEQNAFIDNVQLSYK